jgi:hypothetical protein
METPQFEKPPTNLPLRKSDELGVDREVPQIIEMDTILQRVPKIEGTFDPDEGVKKLLSTPREQRKEAVAEFKDKLARQREAWALCRTTIEERIEANPDISREEMIGILGQFASNYGFVGQHIRTAEQLIDGFIEHHKRVNETREKYPNDIKLINRLTGMNFTQSDRSDFKVVAGPMSLEISCSGFNTGRIFEKSKDPVIGFQYGGFASQSADSKPIYYLVVNNDYSVSNPEYHATIVPHEREHQKNRLMSPKIYGRSGVRTDVRETLNRGVLGFLRHQVGERVLGFERNFEDEVYQRYESAREPEEKAFLLGEYMRLKRESALNRAKDEIIAMKAEPNYPRYNYNIFLDKDGGSYDYLAKLRDWDKKKDDILWQETAKRVLVDEYGSIIDSAITAFDDLRRLGYTQAEVIAMLSDKRLSDWPKTVRRLMEERQPKL